MLTANKLKLIFFNEAKHNQEGNITQYLSPTDLIHLSKISTEANRLHKTKIHQTCFSRFIQFMSHPDILGKPIIDKKESIVISRYPNEHELTDLKNGNSILNALDRITSPLFLDLKRNLVNKKVKAPFKLLFIPEIFQLSELHESIRNKLKNLCYLYSAYLLTNISSTIKKDRTLDSEGKLDPLFIASAKEYHALPYKIARLRIMPDLCTELDLKVRGPISYSIENSDYYVHVNNLNNKALQLLFDHKIIYFHETRYQNSGYEYFDSPIMKAAYDGNLKLFEFLSRALQPHNNYSCRFEAYVHSYRSPLMLAARFNRINIVKKILDDEKTVAAALIKADIVKSWTALMHASSKGHAEVVDLMIKKASSLGLVKTLVNFCGRMNSTALTLAADNGYLEVVQQLFPYIEQRIKIEGNSDQNPQYMNQVEVALQWAKDRGYQAIVNFLRPLLQEEEKPLSKQCCVM